MCVEGGLLNQIELGMHHLVHGMNNEITIHICVWLRVNMLIYLCAKIWLFRDEPHYIECTVNTTMVPLRWVENIPASEIPS